MQQDLAALLLAAAAGLAMAVQGVLNSTLGKVTGMAGATLVVHVIGLAAITCVVVFTRALPHGFQVLLHAPWYTYLGGLFSVAIVYAVASSIARVGATAATTAIIAAQVLTAALLDHFGLAGLEHSDITWSKALGVLLLAAGTWFLLKR